MWLWHAPTLCNAAATSRTVLGDPDHFASNNGKRILVAGARATRSPTAFTARRNWSTSLQPALACSVLGIILTFAPRFDLSGLPKPSRSTGNPRHDPRQLGA